MPTLKKILATLLVSMGLVSTSYSSAIEFGAGYAMGNNDNDSVTAFGGINVFSHLGIRLEYTKNITDNDLFSKEDITRYGVYATYTLPLSSAFSITSKIGLVQTDGRFEVLEVIDSVTDSSTDFSYGLELNYNYNENLALFVGYTDYNSELDILDIDSSKIDSANVTFGLKIAL